CGRRPGQRHAARTVATPRPQTIGTVRRRPTHHCPLAGLLARAPAADTVLEDRTRPPDCGSRDRPARITSGRVPPRRRSLSAMGTTAALSRTDHDHARPAERLHLTVFNHPQKMHVEPPGRPAYRWSSASFSPAFRGDVMTSTPAASGSLWARFRFSVVGALLSAPPRRGALKAALHGLAAKTW